jgi:hypothetical protein
MELLKAKNRNFCSVNERQLRGRLDVLPLTYVQDALAREPPGRHAISLFSIFAVSLRVEESEL